MSLEREVRGTIGARDRMPEPLPGSRSEVSPPGAPAPSLPPGNTGPERHPTSELSEGGRKCSEGSFDAARASGRKLLDCQPPSESSEAPYPEAPLASRRADPKPTRIKDKSVYAQFHRIYCVCLHCGYSPVAASHLLRGKNREDVLEALIPLAPWCHEAFDEGNRVNGPHGEVKAANVRAAVARFLRSPAGERQAAYLIRKLGPSGAADYVQRLEAA